MTTTKNEIIDKNVELTERHKAHGIITTICK